MQQLPPKPRRQPSSEIRSGFFELPPESRAPAESTAAKPPTERKPEELKKPGRMGVARLSMASYTVYPDDVAKALGLKPR